MDEVNGNVEKAQSENDDMTAKVLTWLRESSKALYENPSDNNVREFIVEVISNKEVIVDAILNALKPEFRTMAETISGLMVPGIHGEKEEMVRTDD